MFTSERRSKIKNLIYETKRVDVSELSSLFSVSEVTIRKDLEYLEKANVLIRTHGGAVLNEAVKETESSTVRNAAPEDETAVSIAALLPGLISDQEFLFLGTGAICTEIAKALRNKNNLTVLTNNVTAGFYLSENPGINVITPPGRLTIQNGLGTLTGQETVEFLSGKYVDRCIVEADTARKPVGYGIHDSELCSIYRQMIAHSDETIIVMNSRNFGKNAFSALCDFSAAGKLVTDVHIPQDYMQYLIDRKIGVYTSYDIEDL